MLDRVISSNITNSKILWYLKKYDTILSVIEMSMNEIFNMYFGIIDDERDQANVKHPLVDILKLAIIAVLCGMDELDKIVDYGKAVFK